MRDAYGMTGRLLLPGMVLLKVERADPPVPATERLDETGSSRKGSRKRLSQKALAKAQTHQAHGRVRGGTGVMTAPQRSSHLIEPWLSCPRVLSTY